MVSLKKMAVFYTIYGNRDSPNLALYKAYQYLCPSMLHLQPELLNIEFSPIFGHIMGKFRIMLMIYNIAVIKVRSDIELINLVMYIP